MPVDVATDLSIVGRLLLAALLGALIGLEREVHGHPAGMRTHLLVSVGSAAFTVLSIEAFHVPGADPGRIAAQIVSGIGFLGAGAILKEGANIRGLTTAASLWAVAAVGMAAGAAAWTVALTGTILVIVSLWPLAIVADRFVGRDRQRIRLRLTTADPHALGRIAATVSGQGGVIAHLATDHVPGGLLIDIEVRLSDPGAGVPLTTAIADMDGIELLESRADGD
ncbi:MAG TPA: MgtC/SapB family protein [Candidatus Limnocylindrales bacterium]|jgi:putative Mg2+ transporter-C (MgtC) family protein|nr:MgtC/SapB family protein [Candidatus Limnocylindrales bacterium]